MTAKIKEVEVEVEETSGDTVVKDESLMSKVLDASSTPPSVDDVIEGTVIGIEKSAVYIDIPPFGTGIIYGREYINARDIIKKINVGDSVAGKVVSLSNKDGYIEISPVFSDNSVIGNTIFKKSSGLSVAYWQLSNKNSPWVALVQPTYSVFGHWVLSDIRSYHRHA